MNVHASGWRIANDPEGFMRMLPEDKTGRVVVTVAAMSAFVHHAAATSQGVEDIAYVLSPKEQPGKPPEKLWRMLKRSQRRREDPPGIELLQHPSRLAKEFIETSTFTGDCDDVAMLGAAIAARMGFKAIDFVVIAREGREWEHVYFRVRIGSTWYAMDPQETDRPFAERAHARRLDFPVWRT